jgi:two-component system sensor histidine kinase BaeS
MRTKLFLAFILIILLALFSNVVFERLIMRDFDEFLMGSEEDRIYWIMSSVEGSFEDGEWYGVKLNEALHWGLMLGFESYVEDIKDGVIYSADDVLASMERSMVKRMQSFLKLPSGQGEYTWYPLYAEGRELGKLYIRPLERIGRIPIKEEIFRSRGKKFLVISFFIAGGGAVLLAVLFSIYLSRPIRQLTKSAEKIAKGDYGGIISKRKSRDEINKLQESFNYMAEALRREDLLRKHLTSNIAHELRTPLTIIRGNLEAVEDGVISDPQAVFENIKAEIERIIILIEGIEDLTRAEASFFKKGTAEELNLKDFIESIAAGMSKIVEEKGLQLRTEGPPLAVQSYPEKLHIILKNLLTNSYKFTRNGEIAITWGTVSREDVAGFHITVRDTGRGISEAEIPNVFNRFYKGAESSGTGLGLAIVRELVTVLGGEVSVKSSLGKSAEFTVFLPFQQ